MDNIRIFAPEMCLCGFALAVILLDLFIEKKGWLAFVSIVGLGFFIGLGVNLWNVSADPKENTLFNGMFVADNFAIFFKVLLAGAAIMVILATKDYVNKIRRFQGEFYALILFATLGMSLMAATTDLLAIYVSLELSSMSLYALVGFLKDSKSGESSLKYVLLGGISSATLLFGLALVFGVTGHTQIGEIRAAISSSGIHGVGDNPALALGLVMVIAGFGFKIASVPFQMWVPDVYEGAPTPITAFLSVASKAAGFAVILRVFIEAFGTKDLSDQWTIAFAGLAIVSMTIGNVVAMWQTNIKRMLGYSSIAQAGYLMVGVAAYTAGGGTAEGSGPMGILFFLAGYTITNLGAFIVIIAITQKTNSDEIADFAGMGKRAPVLALVLTLCLISLTGLPPASGLWAKVYLFNTAVDNNLLWLVVIGVLNSVISAYYYFRVAKVMWFSAPASEEEVPSSWPLRLALLLASAGVLALFFAPKLLLVPAQHAAEALLNP